VRYWHLYGVCAECIALEHSVWLCVDCRFDTDEGDEEYYVHDAVWAAAGMETFSGMLCVGCLEKRLRRPLRPADFRGASALRSRRSRRLAAAMDGGAL
jgi:hypothetical protein